MLSRMVDVIGFSAPEIMNWTCWNLPPENGATDLRHSKYAKNNKRRWSADEFVSDSFTHCKAALMEFAALVNQ